MSLIAHYISTTSTYYLHLGSSNGIIIPRDYVDSVQDYVQRETQRRRRTTTWTLLQFGSPSVQDFLGYFLHSLDLIRFAAFFATFGSAGTESNHTSTLKQIFLDIVTQRAALLRRPPVFRCGDSQGDDTVDDDVLKPWPSADDPAATVLSSMHPVGLYLCQLIFKWCLTN